MSEWTHIAENMVSNKDWDEYNYFVEHHVQGNGTHGFLKSFLWQKDLIIGIQ